MSRDDERSPSDGVRRSAGDEYYDLVPSRRLSDPDAYRLLIRLGHTTQNLAPRCWSTAAATALAAASHALRALASALYRANIRDHTDRGDQT